MPRQALGVTHVRVPRITCTNMNPDASAPPPAGHPALPRAALPTLPRAGVPAEPPSRTLSESFVPVERVLAIQVIDEDKKFNPALSAYFHAATGDYRIVAVFGLQLTGKSTLLNHLFNTSFEVMNKSNRQQTTKGIWLAESPGVSSSAHVATPSIVVMDVEGTDGRERGEDQDFERKAALFALATLEVLIVNIWETQVGLYQGANMGLLKTVFEVNLSLFGRAKLGDDAHKVLLLFVVRDYLGETPQESLASTITADLHRIWDLLNKPHELAHLPFDAFFDLAFHALPHKVLQKDKFVAEVRVLGDRFVDAQSPSYLFKPAYHHDVPIDGWTMYAELCWEQIDSNKDLDLPTQQILVAKFKCHETATASFADFERALALSLLHDVPSAVVYSDVGLGLGALKLRCLEQYDALASKYTQSVYLQNRELLAEKVHGALEPVFALYVLHLTLATLATFSAGLAKRPKLSSFGEVVEQLRGVAVGAFAAELAHLSLGGVLGAGAASAFSQSLDEVVAKQQLVELNRLVGRMLKALNDELGTHMLDALAAPGNDFWDSVLAKFTELTSRLLTKYAPGGDFGLGTSDRLNEAAMSAFRFRLWELFDTLNRKYISKENLLVLLKDKFDDKFRYDENGVPRLYSNARELETSYGEAKEFAMALFPILTVARLANGEEIVPPVDIYSALLKRHYASVLTEAVEEDSDDEAGTFSRIVTEQEKQQVLKLFKKETDARYVETKRLLMQHVTQIPYYIYLVILVLGWNEFMAVLRNPFFFMLVLMGGAGVWVLYLMNLLGPAFVVLQRMFDEIVAVAKEKLREFVIEDDHAGRLEKIAKAETLE